MPLSQWVMLMTCDVLQAEQLKRALDEECHKSLALEETALAVRRHADTERIELHKRVESAENERQFMQQLQAECDKQLSALRSETEAERSARSRLEHENERLIEQVAGIGVGWSIDSGLWLVFILSGAAVGWVWMIGCYDLL